MKQQPKYTLKYTKEALKDLVVLPRQIGHKIVINMDWKIREDNPLESKKDLAMGLNGKFRLMVDDYRLICKVTPKNLIFVLSILKLSKRCKIHNI